MPSRRGILIYHKDKWTYTPTRKITANFAIPVTLKIYGLILFEKRSVEVTAGVM